MPWWGWTIVAIILALVPVLIFFFYQSPTDTQMREGHQKILKAAAEFYVLYGKPPEFLTQLIKEGLEVSNFLYPDKRIYGNSKEPGSFTLKAEGGRIIVLEAYNYEGQLEIYERYDLEHQAERLGIRKTKEKFQVFS